MELNLLYPFAQYQVYLIILFHDWHELWAIKEFPHQQMLHNDASRHKIHIPQVVCLETGFKIHC